MAMKMPNGYGAVIKLSGKRRKPYAVRITIGFKLAGPEDQPHAVQQYKYLEYFEKRADAVRYLSDYNAIIRRKPCIYAVFALFCILLVIYDLFLT